MAVSPFDSALYRDLLGDREIGALFTDSAEIRAMMLVEGALAKVQGDAGIIPPDSAAAIQRAAVELQIDPVGMAAETGRSAVPVPALVAAFRKAMDAPEHAQYLHWGATSQDIIDTGLMLRLRKVLALLETRLKATALALADQADAHADLPMAGRTYGQVATPTSFGAVLASWGAPLLRHIDRLQELRARLLNVSLGGAAGTLSVIDKGEDLRAALADALGLSNPGASWHAQRDNMGELAGWLTGVTASLGKMGEDLIILTQSGISEVGLGSSGGSSTMPQKQNPVEPSVLCALARLTVALNGAMQGAGVHRQQRDAGAWITEWLSLPQICMATGKALAIAENLAKGLTPVPDAMLNGIDPDGLGLIYAEALSFMLAEQMPRPEAQAAVKDMCKLAQSSTRPLVEIAHDQYANLEVAHLAAKAQLGLAPSEARAFAVTARNLCA